jgi:hypothetical protein
MLEMAFFDAQLLRTADALIEFRVGMPLELVRENAFVAINSRIVDKPSTIASSSRSRLDANAIING